MIGRRVAIIGAGLSGVALAAQLASREHEAPEVVLIERGQRFGPGLAYSTESAAHLLNVRAANMGARADAPDDFARWLETRGLAAPAAFASRATYGAYVEDVLRCAERCNAFGAKLTRVRAEAVACRLNGQSWVTSFATGERVASDAVVLALGHRPPAALAPFENGVPLLDAWDASAIERLPPGDVLLLGTGLTMVDIAVTLAAKRQGTIYALSRRGLTPRAHLDPPRPARQEALHLPPQLSEAVRVFRREVSAMTARGEPWQLAVDRLRADTPRLWRRLPLDVQRRFLRHLRPWWDVHRHRAAPETAAQVTALQKQGRLRVLAGAVVAATPAGDSVSIELRSRGGRARRQLDVAGVVNCTGGDLDLTRATEPLVAQLLKEGVARPHANGLGLDVDTHGRVIGANGAAQAKLYTLGALAQGAFWESTAVPEIRVQAAAIADLLVGALELT